MVTKSIRVMIADNDTAQVKALSTALDSNSKGEFEIISTVSTREAAIKQVAGEPNVLLLNPEVLKQRTLTRFLHSVQSKSPNTRVVLVLKGRPADAEIISDIKTGVRGYIKSSDSPANIARAVRAVNEGEIWAERRVLEKAISKPMLLPATIQARIPGFAPLTDREMEMLTLVLQGATNKEIAEKSGISERTVKTHLYRVYKKLNVKSRTKAIALLSQS